jgi:hypothetical protein
MRKILLLLAVALLSICVFTAWMLPDEGMWTLNQLPKLPWAEMQKAGLTLTPEQIYNPDGTSLKDAIILLGGGTSSFISQEGLILTNHHVAYGAIQSLSSVEDDYLKNGFYAETRDKELSAPSYTASIVVSQKDVTAEVTAVVTADMTPEARSKAITAKIRELEKKEKGTSEYDVRISEFYNGTRYYCFTLDVFRDVRLVYAPPTAIGNYGGEVDNWYWPRHTGDFSLMRVYVAPDGKHARYSKDNVPYKPKVFLPISSKGVSEGSFAMIMGFPGRTFRYRTVPEIQLAKDETLPLSVELFKTRMDIMENGWKNNRAVEIKYASKWRGLANVYKNYEGVLEGMRKADIVSVRTKDIQQLQEFINSRPDRQAKFGTVLPDIAALYTDLKTFNRKQVILGSLTSGSEILGLAGRFRNYAAGFAKDSTGAMKPPAGTELKDGLPNLFKNLDLTIDRHLLVAMILKAAELPAGQSIECVRRIAGDESKPEEREKKVREFVDDLYEHSKLTSVESATELLGKDADAIKDDKFVQFSAELDKDNAPIQEKSQAFTAKIGLLRMKLLDAWMAWKGPDIYPDANRTLRLTYGTVKSYYPRDAVYYNYITTLTGVMEKETGVDPFIVPPKLRQLWEKKDFGTYADPVTKDVPVAFLANLDITGGNSGSPVINGKGELIGLAFDGNWEAVVGDYLFQEPLNRSINVDARYILFILDKYSNAKSILNELTIH